MNWWITPPEPTIVQIAATGSIKDSLLEISRYYETRNPLIKVKLFFGTAQEVSLQLENGAKFDVYIGSDEDLVVLKEKNQYVEESRVRMFSNPMVAVAAADTDWDIKEAKELSADTVKRIAIQSEKTKNGKLARQYLQKKGILDAMKDKMLEVKNPKAAIESVKGATSKWTILPATEATRRKNLKLLWIIPAEEYPAEIYNAVRPISGNNEEHARRIMDALQSSISHKIFENAGFHWLGSSAPSR